MTGNRLNEILAQVQAFPSIPGSAAKLLKLLEQADPSLAEIEGVLRLDPGMTANVLRLTNSAYFGLRAQVGSIRRALTLLGLKTVRQLIVTSCVNAMLEKPVPGYELPPGELWRHSIAVSVAAEGLVRELRLPAEDDIFTAALLHDIGKLVLGQHVRAALPAVEALTKEGLSFEQAEARELGIHHGEIGARILHRWSLPGRIVDAVRWHHDPEAAGAPARATDIVHAANVLCLMIGIGVGREGLHYTPSPAVTRRLGIKPGHLERVASQTLQWLADLERAFDDGHRNSSNSAA
jgi:putative nucleotidyltransferase with HDIG domain